MREFDPPRANGVFIYQFQLSSSMKNPAKSISFPAITAAVRRYRSETELRHLVGTGVSAAAIWRMREALDEAGFPAVKIVASSGFGVGKCRVIVETAREWWHGLVT